MDRSRFGAVIGLRLLLSTGLFLIVGGLLVILPLEPSTARVILWSLVVLFPLAIAPDWFLQGRERMVPLGFAKISGYLVYGAAVWLLVRVPDDAPMAPAAFGAGALATSVILWIAVGRTFDLPRFTPDGHRWASILRENIPVGIAVFVGQQVMNLPPLLLAAMRSTTEAGVYTAALKLVFLLLALDRVLNALLLPALTRVRATRPEDLQRVAGLAARSVAVLAGAIVVPGMFIAPLVMQLVFGSAYAAADTVARILLVYVGLTLLNSVAVCVLLATGRERTYSRAMITGSLALAVAMVVLTPLWGTNGTALGAVLGELATVFLMVRGASREARVFTRQAILRPVIASVCAAVPGCALVPWSAIAATAAAVMTFIIATAAMRVFRAEDVAYLRERFL